MNIAINKSRQNADVTAVSYQLSIVNLPHRWMILNKWFRNKGIMSSFTLILAHKKNTGSGKFGLDMHL